MPAPKRKKPSPGRLEKLHAAFPTVMNYTGLVGVVVAVVATWTGHPFGVPLLGAFLSMMGIGQIADAFRSRDD